MVLTQFNYIHHIYRGTAVARVIGQNVQSNYIFEKQVNMYVYEEMINGEKLTDIINKKHENTKYLPGIKLSDNITAVSDIRKTVADAHLLVFVMPHQFVKSLCRQIQGHLRPGVKAISLIKGFDCENNKINLITQYIRSILHIECCSLSGANVAADVANEQFAETTIGYEDVETAQVFQLLFDTPYFKVNAVPDVAGVELCGALKNIVAIGAGFIDGLQLGSNTKAAIIRLGLLEMRRFAAMFYSGVIEETFWDSSGVADLITTCYGGRNRKCAELFIKTKKSFSQIEQEILNGQKLQGTHTARDVYVFLTAQGKRQFFPLFTTVYEICDAGAPPDRIVKVFMTKALRPIVKSHGSSPVQLDELVRSKL